MNAALNAI